MPENATRRSFLSKSAVAGASSLLVNSKAEAASQKNNRKFKVGAFCVGEYSFWPIWAELLDPNGRLGTNILNMEVTHVWDVNPKTAQEFADKWGCKVVKEYDGMIGKVDGVVNGGFYEIPWQHKIFRPYLKAGVPTYLSRPWSYRLIDMD